MSETGILITYVSVAFSLLALIFVYTAFAKANHEDVDDEITMLFVLGAIFWPAMLPLAVIGLCATLVACGFIFANDALARYIRRKSK
jgi:ABC-type antimicrobial peptide transport system permease subunit